MIGPNLRVVASRGATRVGAIPVRLIRALDRRGGFTSRRGEAAYAWIATWLGVRLHRRIADEVIQRLGDRLSPTIVDLGSGPGTLATELGRRLPSATVVGVEPNVRMRVMASAQGASANVRFIDGSAERIPVPDASVDLVVSSLSAHHWSDLERAVREIRRVLRPGGSARIYDVRFATFTAAELGEVGARLGAGSEAVRRSVPDGQGSLPLVALIEIAPLAPAPGEALST